MEHNEAYNIFQLNNLTGNEAIYDTCEPTEEQPEEKQQNTSTAAQDYDNCDIHQDKSKNSELLSIKCNFVSGFVFLVGLLVLVLTLVGLVLCTTHHTAETDTMNKILTAIQNISDRIDGIQTASVDNIACTTALDQSITPTPHSAGVSSTTTPSNENAPTTSEVQCGGPGWSRIAFINMSEPNQNCPQGLSETPYSIRSCGRAHSKRESCSSLTFSVNNSTYSQVCGRVIAYQWGLNHAFWGSGQWSHSDIESPYVDGISLTHGSPRTHIWTFTAGLFNGTTYDSCPNWGQRDDFRYARCPCDPGNTFNYPQFVGNDYFCESVETMNTWGDHSQPPFHPDNPLWDGEGCEGNNNTCCLFNNPPWFQKTLPNPTSDDIELRMCFIYLTDQSNIGVQLLELHVM